MNAKRIIRELAKSYYRFPEKPLRVATAPKYREEITTELLDVLIRTENHLATRVSDTDYLLCQYAMFLLAQFREKRAYPLIVNLASHKDDVLEPLLGDILTEDLHRILASVACGDPELLKSMFENREIDEFARVAALNAMVLMVKIDELSRDQVITYFKSLFDSKLERTYSFAWEGLVSCSVALYPEELFEDIKQVFEDDLIDPMYISFEEVEKALEQPRDVHMQSSIRIFNPTLITDAVADLRHWFG
jgi:hypothetical protein